MKKSVFIVVLVVLLMVAMVGCTSTATKNELNMTIDEYQSHLVQKYDLDILDFEETRGYTVPILKKGDESIIIEVSEWVIATHPTTDFGVWFAVSPDDFQDMVDVAQSCSEKLNVGRTKVLFYPEREGLRLDGYCGIVFFPNVYYFENASIDGILYFYSMSLEEFKELNPEIDITKPITGEIYIA